MRRVVGTIMLVLLLSVLSVFVVGCYIDNKITQYLVLKTGETLEPIAKVTYKVSVDRQEIIYWMESPSSLQKDKNQGINRIAQRSDLFRMKNCIVVDTNNWEGDDGLRRVHFIDGKFLNNGGPELSVSWWAWHFMTHPKPSYLAGIVGGCMALVFVGGLVLSFIDQYRKRGGISKTN